MRAVRTCPAGIRFEHVAKRLGAQVERFGGERPLDAEALPSFKGIGAYTPARSCASRLVEWFARKSRGP